jgi:hypothetical protein
MSSPPAPIAAPAPISSPDPRFSLSDPGASVPPMARTLPPMAPARFRSSWLHGVGLFLQGLYELARHLGKRGREVWRSNERVVDLRARVRLRPLPYLIGAAMAFVLLMMIASSTDARLDAEAMTAVGAVGDSRHAAVTAKLASSPAELPPCKPADAKR